MSPVEVHRFSRDRIADFFAIHSDANGHGWCRCVAWWVPDWDGFGERTSRQNRLMRDRLVERGVSDGYLLYRNDEPVGWCQAWPLAAFPKLLGSFDLEAEPGDWMIGCFVIAPRERRRGLAGSLLRHVLQDLPSRGALRVLAFPKRGSELDADDLWNGPETMFQAEGFSVWLDDPKRPVLARDLAPTA